MKRILVATLLVLCVAASASQAHAMPAFSGSTKRAVFLSPLEDWYQTWNLDTYRSVIEKAGYQVDVFLNGEVSIAFLETGLSNYDLIILRTDSFAYEGADYYCAGDPVTPKSSATFASQILLQEVHVSACVGFSTKFIQHNYPSGSLRGLVYVLAPSSANLSYVFRSAGASVFIGYTMDFSLRWGRMDAMTQKYFSYLANGETVIDASWHLSLYLRAGHGITADWLQLYWVGDGNYVI